MEVRALDLKEGVVLGLDPAAHWYYVSKGHMLRALLPRRSFSTLLDVGAGSGVFARQLLAAGVCERAVCVDVNYETEWVEEQDGRKIRFLKNVRDPTADLVLMIDVLEHVDDAEGLLRRYTANLSPGTLVLVTVPAFQLLWSGHDEFLGHRRRYTLRGLEELMAAAGLQTLAGRYYFALILPVAAALRLMERIYPPGAKPVPKSALRACPAWQNKLLIALHALERASLFKRNRVAGLTVVCLAQKP